MKLSKLAYQCVKNAIYYDDPSFTYEQFLMGKHDSNPDYANNIRNVFGPINAAVMRLGDLERIPYRVDKVDLEEGFFPKSDLSKACRSVVAVATMKDGAPYPLSFKDFGDKVLVERASGGAVLVEYKEDIPPFNTESYTYDYVLNDLGGYSLYGTPSDIELKDYGITDAMCWAIVEYVKGSLNEQVDSQLANMHMNRAEQYFSNIEPAKSALRQQTIKTAYKMGE